MDVLYLRRPTEYDIPKIEQYRSEFSVWRTRVTLDPERIPGLDHLERFDNISDWLAYCEKQSGKISWYMTVRKNDEKTVGFICLRHRLEYDDDDIEFASNLGYSVRPSEQGKGYGREQLRLALKEAGALGLERARIVCLDTNIRSNRTIIANGGVYIDTIRGDESGLTVNRYDVKI